MNVFRALSHPVVAGDDDLGWIPTPLGVARHAMRGCCVRLIGWIG